MNTLLAFLPSRKFLVVSLLVISGCANLQPVNIADEAGRTAIAKGDTVVVTTTSDQVHTLKIVDITADGLHGKDLSIPYTDIRLLQIRRVDVQKTVWLTLGVIGLGALASDGGGSGGGGGGY
jgi:hypothetical protein